MCGIMASIGEHSQDKVFYGLQLLQHRGQDGFGIYNQSDNQNKLIKQKGYVNQYSLEPNQISNLAVGHNRYSTIGRFIEKDLQPFLKNEISVAHNGNITNLENLKNKFNKYTFESNNDAEIFLAYLENVKTIEELKSQVAMILDEVEGAYSVVGSFKGYVFAFKDKYSIKPLAFGRGKNTFAFASESHVLTFLGYNEVENLKAGELIVVSSDEILIREELKQGGFKPCMFEWVYFAGIEGQLYEKNIYQVRYRSGQLLSKQISKNNWEIDLVAPVPDTSRTSAQAFSDISGISYREILIKNRYVQRSFILNSQLDRENAVLWKLNPVISEIKDKNILLIDDSIVRGTTSKRIVSILKKYGANKVYLASCCPEIVNPCYYGIDFPDEKDLLAKNRNLEEMQREIGCDGLVFLTKDSLKEAIGLEDMCMACLDGKYPVKVNSESFFTQRRPIND